MRPSAGNSDGKCTEERGSNSSGESLDGSAAAASRSTTDGNGDDQELIGRAQNFTSLPASKSSVEIDDDPLGEEHGQAAPVAAAAAAQPLTYLVSQNLILMGMAGMYFLAFYGAYRQNEGLMGSRGLSPSRDWFENTKERYGCRPSATTNQWFLFLLDPNCWRGFGDFPSVFWWFDPSDENMRALLMVGTTLSVFCGLGRFTFANANNNSSSSSSMALWMVLWILYFSVVTSAGGTSFYAYGWESQVLETGFLCAFLCSNWVWPVCQQQQQQQQCYHSSPLVLWLFRWLSFRISIGAGMIKIRGDSCWTQKTCLLYHFETQPIPSPLSFVFHFLPGWMLKKAVDLDLFVQVYTSWFVVLPTRRINAPRQSSRVSSHLVRSFFEHAAKVSLFLVRLGGFLQVAFMANIGLSGNMSMLNHLTILPALACLDDACYPVWVRDLILGGKQQIRSMCHPSSQQQQQQEQPDRLSLSVREIDDTTIDCYKWKWSSPRTWIDVLVWGWILLLSWPVVANLLELDGTHQKMNASFGSFRLVNSYGAFGSVGKQRYEPIVSVAYAKQEKDSRQQQQSRDELEWIEIEFPCKPGSLHRRPCFCAPYHYRLDWNIWFIGFKPHSHYLNQRESWLYSLLTKMLGDEGYGTTSRDDDDGEGGNGQASKSGWWEAKMSTQRRRERQPWLDLLDGASGELLEQRGSPLYAKVDMYRYEMAAPLWELLPEYLRAVVWGNEGTTPTVRWWNRYYEEPLLPVIAFDAKRGQLVKAEP